MVAQGEATTFSQRFEAGDMAEKAKVISEAHEAGRFAFEDMMIIYDTASIPEKLGIYAQAKLSVAEFRQQLLGSGELSDELVRAYADANFTPQYLEVYGPDSARDAVQQDLEEADIAIQESKAISQILDGGSELNDMSSGDKQKLLTSASQSFRYRAEADNFYLNLLEQANNIDGGQNRDIGMDNWGTYLRQFRPEVQPRVTERAQAIQSCSSIIYELRHRLGL